MTKTKTPNILKAHKNQSSRRIEKTSLTQNKTTKRQNRLNGKTTLQPNGGGGRDRTDDLLLAKQALSQLSYTPAP